jgi:uncharacterized protein
MKRNFLVASLCLLGSVVVVAQQNNNYNALLWKVSGNGLKKASYLFGTYHFFTNGFTDTIQAVKNAYAESDAVVGELHLDSSIQAPMMEASLLKGTTLQKELPDTLYKTAGKWFKEEAGFDIAQLNQVNPFAIISFAMAITQQKYFPNKPGEVQLDTYFQQAAKKDGKKVLALETIQRQINAIYGQMTLQRQVSLLSEMLKEKDGLKQLVGFMNTAYISQNMDAMQQLMYGSSYKPEEVKALLDDRNDYWMQQLPGLMNEQSLFVAVGALHLVGKTGLVNQLKAKGYSVTPVNIKNQ